jgi:hypothetical protein
MNEKLLEFFNAFKHLRSMQTIVEEILMLDYYVDNFDEAEAIVYLDFCIDKYDFYIRRIGSLYKDMVVIDNDTEVYEKKSSEEINSDREYIRDCLIIIGTVQSGIRPDLQTVIEEIN